MELVSEQTLAVNFSSAFRGGGGGRGGDGKSVSNLVFLRTGGRGGAEAKGGREVVGEGPEAAVCLAAEHSRLHCMPASFAAPTQAAAPPSAAQVSVKLE